MIMKQILTAFIFCWGALLVRGQGTITWDQQDTNIVDGASTLANQPLGQSFTPAFDSIDVSAFFLGGGAGPFNVQVNLRSGSITGAILGTSGVVSYTGSGVYDFFFPSSIALTPGTKYYLQLFLPTPAPVSAQLTSIQYTGGDAIINGTTFTGEDFWFQEGVVSNVPEPSLAALLVVGGSALCWMRRRKCVIR
jgi:hypothetical protein